MSYTLDRESEPAEVDEKTTETRSRKGTFCAEENAKIFVASSSSATVGDWTAAEDAMLTSGEEKFGKSWGVVAAMVTDRSHAQCRRRFEETWPL
jgi:hypothetical protein